MKRTKYFLIAALLVLALTGCGGSGGNSAASQSTGVPNDFKTDGMGAPEASVEEDDAGWDADVPDTGNLQARPSDAKMIYTAQLTLETQEFDTAAAGLSQLVTDLGGYFESRSLYQGGTYRNLECVVRVPADNFLAFLEQAGQKAHLVHRSEHGDDVSESYYDSEARLTTQRTKLERLQTLLSQAETMEDIISLESAISETELQIEYLTGELRHYDSQINYSTVTLSLQEVYRLSSEDETPLTFGQRLGAAFSTGWQRGVAGLEDFTVGVARNWVAVLLLCGIVAVAVVVHRRTRRKKKAVPPPNPPEDTPKK